MKVIINTVLLLLVVITLSPAPVHAAPFLAADSFEDSELDIELPVEIETHRIDLSSPENEKKSKDAINKWLVGKFVVNIQAVKFSDTSIVVIYHYTTLPPVKPEIKKPPKGKKTA